MDRPTPATACAECAAPLAPDQRYCLSCGARCAAPRLDPLAHAHGNQAGSATAAAPPIAPAALPGPRIAALLTLAVLAVGTGIGVLAGADAPVARATAGRRIVLLDSPAPAPVAAPATTPAPAASDPVPVDTPAPADVTPAPATAPEAPAAPVAPEPAAPAAPAPSSSSGDDTPLVDPTPAAPTGPAISHVWVVSLSGHGHPDTFGPTAPDPWFREVLARQGALLNNVHAVSPGSLADGLALLAGTPPRPATDQDCPDLAQGCTVPEADGSLLEQLDGVGKTWKAYVEPAPDGTTASCKPASGPVAARNPVAFLEGVTKDPACPSHLAGLDALDADLVDPETTPAFSLLVPNACHDGRDAPCAQGAPAGLPAASQPVHDLLDRIRASKAYTDGGLIVVLFDHGVPGDTSARKGAPKGQGGGSVGAVLLSPFVTPGHQIAAAYDQYSVLKTVEQLFSVPALGGAGEPGVKAFGPKVFDAKPPSTG